MYREKLNNMYEYIEGQDLQAAQKIASQLSKAIEEDSFQRKLSWERGSHHNIIISLGKKVVNLKEWVNSRLKISPHFKEGDNFEYKANTMPPKEIFYVPEEQKGFWLSFFYAIALGAQHTDHKKIMQLHPNDYGIWLSDKNAWMLAIRELQAFKEENAINLGTEFATGDLKEKDYANIYMIMGLTKSALTTILENNESPIIKKIPKDADK